MPSNFLNDYSHTTPFRISDVGLALLVLCVILLGGGTSLVIKSFIFLALGLFIFYQPPKTVPFREIDLFIIALVVFSWVQFLPKSFLSEAAWASQLCEEHDIRLSSTVSVQTCISLEAYLSLLAAIAFFYICLNQDIYYATRVRSCWTLALGGAALGMAVIIGNYFQWSYPFAKETAVFSFFPNRNQTSHILCLSAFISFCLFIKAFHKKQNYLALIALSASLIAFFALVYCLSRASLIFFFLGLIIWLCLQERRRQGFIQFRYLVPLGCIFISFWLISSGENLNRFLHVLNPFSEVDFRFLIFKDTLACIREQIWTGVGLGNFQYVFPQFREHSVLYGRVIHPENDWLWICSELGIGFTLLVFAGVLYGLFKSLKNQPSNRVSYRSIACIAVLIFIFHTFTDVPGHRLGTAFYAILLFALASAYHERVESLIPIYIFRGVGLILVCAGLLILGSIFFQWPLGYEARAHSYKRVILHAVQSKNIDQALDVIEQAKAKFPLQPQWYFQEAQIQLPFNKNYALAKKAFEQARALDPHSVYLPLQEGLIWLPYDLDLAFKAWQAALNLDNYSRDSTWRFILSSASDPRCKEHLSLLSKTHPGFRAFYLMNLEPSVLEKEIQYDLLKDPKLSYMAEKDRFNILMMWAGGPHPHSVLGVLDQLPDIVSQTWRIYAKAYHTLGFFEAAARLLDKHVQAPQWPVLNYSQGSRLEELEFRSSLNPKDTILALGLLKIYIEQEKYVKALATIRHLEKLEYLSPLLAYWKGKLCCVQGQYSESAEAYEEFLAQPSVRP